MKTKRQKCLTEAAAIEIAKKHLLSQGEPWIVLKECKRRRPLMWFGPAIWHFFVDVGNDKEFGITFLEDHPEKTIYSTEIDS